MERHDEREAAATAIQALFRGTHARLSIDNAAALKGLRTRRQYRIKLTQMVCLLSCSHQSLTTTLASLTTLHQSPPEALLQEAAAWLGIRDSASEVVVNALRLSKWCSSVAAPSSWSRFHVPHMAPFEVNPEDRLLPALATLYLASRPLQVVCSVVGLGGTVTEFLLIYDILPWPACFPGGLQLAPAAFIAACLNKSIVRQLLLRNFQTLFVLASTALMFGCFCFLWRNHPGKSVAMALRLPTLMLASLIDAYPEGGRVPMSRIFFIACLMWLTVLQVGVVLSLFKVDDQSISANVGQWSIKVSTIACGGLSSLTLFAFKNLLSTAIRPGSLAVVRSQVGAPLVFLELQRSSGDVGGRVGCSGEESEAKYGGA
jgi:hypothetical protein